MRKVRVIVAVTIASFGIGGRASAQTPPNPVPDLSPFVGQRIEVTDGAGSVVTGQLIRISEANLVLRIDQTEAELEMQRIRGISYWKKDSVANGILIGLGLGFVIPAFIGAAVDTGEPGEAAALLIPPGVAIGLAIGWIVDAFHQTKTPVFGTTAARAGVRPLLGSDRSGLVASVRF